MKIIDFEKKGNVVRFYLGADDDKDYHGDDWGDFPYYSNAGIVYSQYVTGHRDIAFPINVSVLEPKDSGWYSDSCLCKNDLKKRRVPCIIVVPDTDVEYGNDFDKYIKDKKTIKFYFGDKLEPAESLTTFGMEDK